MSLLWTSGIVINHGGRPKGNESNMLQEESSLLADVSICPAGRGLYLCWEAKEKRPLPRSDTSSVHDRGRVKPVCKASSETSLEKQIVRMLRAELRCNDIEPVVSKWRLEQRGHSRFFMLFESALTYVIDIFKDETVKAVTEEQKKAIFSVLSGRDTSVCL